MSKMARSTYQLDSLPDRDVISWRQRAACRLGGRLGDPEAWFVVGNGSTLPSMYRLVATNNRDALLICQTECPVRSECHEDMDQMRAEGFPIKAEVRAGFWFDSNGGSHTTGEPDVVPIR